MSAGLENGAEIAHDLLSTTTEKNDIVNFVFPNAVLRDPETCLARGIFAQTNEQVEGYNNTVLDRIDGESKRYFAVDSLKDVSKPAHTTALLDFLARQQTPRGWPQLPPRCLHIKTNAVYCVLSDSSRSRHAGKNVVVTELGNDVITVKALRVPPALGDEEDILISRMDFLPALSSGHTLLRRQFPLVPVYSTTFHDCGGVDLIRNLIGVDLTRRGFTSFTQDQLYTVLSAVKRRENVMLRLHAGESASVLLPANG